MPTGTSRRFSRRESEVYAAQALTAIEVSSQILFIGRIEANLAHVIWLQGVHARMTPSVVYVL